MIAIREWDMLDQAPACADGTQAGMSLCGNTPQREAVRLFVGGDSTYIGRERVLLHGDRCWTAAHHPRSSVADPSQVVGLLDSGAFTDPPDGRLTPAAALARQLAWERKAAKLWGVAQWQAAGLVSYDRLIDETWIAGCRQKRRWTVAAAEGAVAETVAAAAFLARQRAALTPRTLVLSCQGVDAPQYRACVEAVLCHATPDDWIGLGGWCILGRYTTWLPTFWATLHAIMPLIAAADVRHVHLFGVLYRPALGGLVWLADQYGLRVSVDSSAPLLSASYTTAAGRKKSGCRGRDWRENVAWWRRELGELRASPFYRPPPYVPAVRQQTLW